MVYSPIVLVPLAEFLHNEVLQPLLDYVLRKVQTFQETVAANSLVQLLECYAVALRRVGVLQKFHQHCVYQFLPFLQDLRLIYCAFFEVLYQSWRGPDLNWQLRLATLGRPIVLVYYQNFILL